MPEGANVAYRPESPYPPLSALRLSPEAVEELAEPTEWYRTQRPGLEMKFLTEGRRVLPLIEASPASSLGHHVGGRSSTAQACANAACARRDFTT